MTRPFMHQIELPRMSEADITRIIAQYPDHELLTAIKHLLRDKAAEMTDLGHAPPQWRSEPCTLLSTAPTAGEYRAHHAGAAIVCEELFFTLVNAGIKTQEQR